MYWALCVTLWPVLWKFPASTAMRQGVAGALVAAQLALAGIRSPIPADEAILAMKRVGDAMPTALKETAEGGLAADAARQAAVRTGVRQK